MNEFLHKLSCTRLDKFRNAIFQVLNSMQNCAECAGLSSYIKTLDASLCFSISSLHLLYSPFNLFFNTLEIHLQVCPTFSVAFYLANMVHITAFAVSCLPCLIWASAIPKAARDSNVLDVSVADIFNAP